MNTAIKPQQAIDKETFDALKQTTQDKSMFKLVYGSEDRRPAYFSFYRVITYTEVGALIGFSMF